MYEDADAATVAFDDVESFELDLYNVVVANGRYVAEAVPRGKLRVLVTASKETGKIIKEYSTPRPEVINLIPDKYRNGIPIEVNGDNPNQDFALKSR